MFNIITRRALLSYCVKYPYAANALREWYSEMIRAEFSSFQELRAVYGSVSLVGDDRVVFNIMGNHFRLVVRIVFKYRAIQVKWFGTHKAYDSVDVLNVGRQGM